MLLLPLIALPQPDRITHTASVHVRSPNDRSVIGFGSAIVALVSSDYAIASAHGPLWIIHGHGTGKLRHEVQVFLTSHPRVERFEFAEQSDGGSGVTIAYCRS